MENAIKALLIAAGVLVAVLIISLGMNIYNKSSSIDTTSTLNSVEIAKFNRRYEQYEGIHSGRVVKTVLNYVLHDNKYLEEERNSEIGINLRSNVPELINAFPSWGNALTTRSYGVMLSSNISLFRDKVISTKKYKIWYKYDNNGLIHEIHIDEPYT